MAAAPEGPPVATPEVRDICPLSPAQRRHRHGNVCVNLRAMVLASMLDGASRSHLMVTSHRVDHAARPRNPPCASAGVKTYHQRQASGCCEHVRARYSAMFGVSGVLSDVSLQTPGEKRVLAARLVCSVSHFACCPHSRQLCALAAHILRSQINVSSLLGVAGIASTGVCFPYILGDCGNDVATLKARGMPAPRLTSALCLPLNRASPS